MTLTNPQVYAILANLICVAIAFLAPAKMFFSDVLLLPSADSAEFKEHFKFKLRANKIAYLVITPFAIAAIAYFGNWYSYANLAGLVIYVVVAFVKLPGNHISKLQKTYDDMYQKAYFCNQQMKGSA